ncbi:MAG: MotA/TolQ/ExbB proton channel family protein [Acidobacteriota bacterium]|nr:MAG: MotA/TolQ/ExbB proton channel family protein [Acidobacteriota bacterium]
MRRTSFAQTGTARTVFLLAVALSATALLGLSFVRGQSMIDMMARAITEFVIPLNAMIMFGFAVIISLAVGVFVHYYMFELRDQYLIDTESAKRVAAQLRATDQPFEKRLQSAYRMLETDETLFGQILRRFLKEKGLQQPTPSKAWQEIQDEEFERVKRNLMYFSLASVIAPAMGFLGTAVGMVAAFYEISILDHVTPSDLATAIQIALITTVVGLVIKTIAMLLKTMVIHSVGRREDQLAVAYQRLLGY